MASPTVIASPHKRLLDRHTQKKLAGIGRVIMILPIMIIVCGGSVLLPRAGRHHGQPLGVAGASDLPELSAGHF